MSLDHGKSEGQAKIANSEEKPITVELQALRLGRDVDEDGDEDDECESEISSPIFWKYSSHKSPIESFSSHTLVYTLSRAELIEQGRKELMAMVQNLPESSYELSLRDIVDIPLVSSKNGRIEDSEVSDKIDKRKGKSKSFNKTNARHDHINIGGLFLKMFFPVSASPKKKRSKSEGGSRILPCSPSFEGKVRLDGEFWKNKSASAVDDKYKSRGSISNRGRREKREDGVMLPHPCWPFFRTCHCITKGKKD